MQNANLAIIFIPSQYHPDGIFIFLTDAVDFVPSHKKATTSLRLLSIIKLTNLLESSHHHAHIHFLDSHAGRNCEH